MHRHRCRSSLSVASSDDNTSLFGTMLSYLRCSARSHTTKPVRLPHDRYSSTDYREEKRIVQGRSSWWRRCKDRSLPNLCFLVALPLLVRRWFLLTLLCLNLPFAVFLNLFAVALCVFNISTILIQNELSFFLARERKYCERISEILFFYHSWLTYYIKLFLHIF